MKVYVEGFKRKVKECSSEREINQLCFEWLRFLCKEYGKDGRRAFLLLDIVEEMLDI